jgi:MFS family permease
MFVYGTLTAFFPLYSLQCGVTNPGLFFMANAVVMVAGRAVGGKIFDTYNKEKIILTLILISMAAMFILSFSKTLPVFIFVGLPWGIGDAFFMPACMAYGFEYAGSSGGAAVRTYQAFKKESTMSTSYR